MCRATRELFRRLRVFPGDAHHCYLCEMRFYLCSLVEVLPRFWFLNVSFFPQKGFENIKFLTTF